MSKPKLATAPVAVIDKPDAKISLEDVSRWRHATRDIANGRFRDLEVLKHPGGCIDTERTTARVIMDRDTWERLSQAAYMRGTSAAEIIRVLVTDWLDEVKA